MADGPKVGEMLRQAARTNARFYAGLAELSIQYVQSVSEIFTDTLGTGADARPPGRSPEGSSALVLEGEAGTQALGHFLVENKLPREVAAKPAASSLVDEDGVELEQRVAFGPAEISLGPHERIAVQVAVEIDETLELGNDYRGTITVPGLADGAAGLVVRRVHAVEASPEADEPAPARNRKKSRARSRKPAAASRKKKTKKKRG